MVEKIEDEDSVTRIAKELNSLSFKLPFIDQEIWQVHNMSEIALPHQASQSKWVGESSI